MTRPNAIHQLSVTHLLTHVLMRPMCTRAVLENAVDTLVNAVYCWLLQLVSSVRAGGVVLVYSALAGSEMKIPVMNILSACK